MTACLSDLRLDRWAAGELTAAEETAARAHADACAGCEQRLRAHTRDRAELRRSPAFGQVARTLGLRRHRARIAGAVALAGLAGLVFVLRPFDQAEHRRKGSAAFGFFVEHAGQVRRGAPGEVVQVGDALRFVFRPARPRFVAVIGLDPAGAAQVYYPDDRPEAVLVDGEAPAPYSTILDATTGTETLFAIECQQAQPLEPLRRAIEQSRGAPDVPRGCVLEQVPIAKVAP